MPTILGAHSPRIAALRKLRTSAGRRAAGRFAVDGTTMLGEALAAGRTPEALFATARGLSDLNADPRFATLAAEALVVPDRAMAKLSDVVTPPGVLAVYRAQIRALDELLADGEPGLVLAGLNDPGNAGTLLRTAEIFGITAAIFGSGGVEPYHPKVVRASMGAIFRMRIATSSAQELTLAARANRYEVVALGLGGTPLPHFRFERRALIAVGNERRGTESFLERVDREVAVPQRGAGESLNAAIAGGIVLYAFARAQEAGTSPVNVAESLNLSRLGGR